MISTSLGSLVGIVLFAICVAVAGKYYIYLPLRKSRYAKARERLGEHLRLEPGDLTKAMVIASLAEEHKKNLVIYEKYMMRCGHWCPMFREGDIIELRMLVNFYRDVACDETLSGSSRERLIHFSEALDAYIVTLR